MCGEHLEYPEGLDQSGVRRDSGRPGEDDDSTIGSHKDQLSNLEAALLGQGGGELYNQGIEHGGPSKPVAWKQRYHDQDCTVFSGAIYGT